MRDSIAQHEPGKRRGLLGAAPGVTVGRGAEKPAGRTPTKSQISQQHKAGATSRGQAGGQATGITDRNTPPP